MQLNARAVRHYVAAALITLALPAYSSAQAISNSGPSPANAALSAIRIENFARVDSTYYRGAQPRGRDYSDLAALGVRTVIDLTKDGDRAESGMVQRAGMKFFRIPMTTHETPTADVVSRFLQLVTDPANQPVYVHCQGGRHRTGVMTAVYRMTVDGWSSAQAFSEMKRYGFGADFLHPEFKRFVSDYRPAAAGDANATPGAKKGTAAMTAGTAKQPVVGETR